MDKNKTTLGISEDIIELGVPIPSIRNYYRDESERNFYVDDFINIYDDNGNLIGVDLLELNKMIIRCNKEDKGIPVEQREPIRVWIDSGGGDTTALWSTIQAIRISKTPVYTICYRSAMSAAADLLVAGHKRYALPGTSVMVHSGSCMYGGTMEQAESMKKYYDKLGKKITDYFLSHTKIELKVYKKKAPSDWYFDEEEALELGVIDEIVTDLDILY